jgi:hypothetical protein
MVTEARTDAEALYVCPETGCGRRLIVNWLRPSLTVLDQGDFWARHVSGSEGLRIDLAAG